MKRVDHITTIAQELGIDDAEIARRKSFLEFTDADVELLRQLHAQMQESGEEFAVAFYDHVLRFPEMSALIPDAETLERLKKSQAAHFSQLSGGEYGEQYVQQRVAMFTDISRKREAEELIWRQANFDALTELPNRQMFHDRLDQDLKKANRASQPLPLMMEGRVIPHRFWQGWFSHTQADCLSILRHSIHSLLVHLP